MGTDDPPAEAPGTCDFCRHDVVLDTVTGTVDGRTYECCSTACRDRLVDDGYVFSEHHDTRRFDSGVSGLDAKLPEGIPRNSLVLVSGMTGTRQEAILVELVWRALRRGEPVVAVTFTEPPGSFVQHFHSLDWNVLPYLERGDLQLVDAFTYRMDDRDRMFDRMNRWNHHLYGVAEDVTETVRDAGDMSELANKLDNCLEAADMSDRGLVVVDSLTELGTLVQPISAYDFVKDLRADVCKGRFVPVFAGATLQDDDVSFPHDLGYVMDGVVQLQVDAEVVPETLIKRVRIRKLGGVLSIPEWTAYEYTSGLGMVTFDPREQIERARAGQADGAAGASDTPEAGETAEGAAAGAGGVTEGDGPGDAASSGDDAPSEAVATDADDEDG